MMKRAVLFLLLTAACCNNGIARAQNKHAASPSAGGNGNLVDIQNLLGSGGKGDKNEPTYINSNSLTLKAQDRTFEYSGNVQVKHGDMTLTADVLDGRYTEKNDIDQLVARKNVVISRENSLRAKCERAVYDAKARIITLTENPELEQNGSTLMADAIKIFLDENRSVAEGQVRVKVTGPKNLEQATQKK